LRIRNNGVFFKILSCFVAVILIISLAFGVILLENSDRSREAAVLNLNREFESGAENVSRIVSQIRYSMSEFSVKAAADLGFENGSYIDKNVLRAEMRDVFVDRRQNEFSKYLLTAFLVDTLQEEYVYDLTGTYSNDAFYNHLFVSEFYTAEFWKMQTGGGENFEILPADTYTVLRNAKQEEIELLPIAYKPKSESRYVLVMLLDVKALAADAGISAISNDVGLVYVSDEVSDRYGDGDILKDAELNGDEIFRFWDGKNGNVGIYRIISKSDIRSAKLEINLISLILFVFLMALAVLFAVGVSWIAAKKIKKTSRGLMSNSLVRVQFESGLDTFKDIENAVKIIASQESPLEKETEATDSVLDSMVLRAHMRDVYAGVEDIEAKLNFSKAFFMAYFKVSYKKKFLSYMQEDTGKATFLLKQLIETHLKNIGVSSMVLQTEKDGIVAVADASDAVLPQEIIKEILQKLSNESEYAYFTISVSGVHDGTGSIKEVYEGLVDTVKFAKPITENQIISENEGRGGVSKFYFSVEEMGKFSATLQNGTEDEVIKKVDEIIEYNLRKDVNRFEMYLLCTEIVNCAIKLVNRVFYTIPQSVDVASVYDDLAKAVVPEEYREICVDFLHQVIEYIKENKREDDYIISYIFDYVENHYSEDIYLNLFAEKLKLTGAYISSYFKEKTNVNLTDYINNYRIKKAVALSENPQNKNKDIAEMVGLPNINTFIRLFKKYTGYTPGEYRKKHFGDDGKN